EDKGVKANVPDDNAEIRTKDFGSPGSTANFRVIRELVNFEVVVKGTNNPVGGFSPPMVITVCYTKEDAASAGGANKLKLGMWDGNDWKNIPIKPANACPFEGFEGAFEAKITARWADPPVALGN
ncbi:MAG TPA: hypothetical protein VLE70_07125, partial [Anaerolineae bacterium]|nr:hypothetical protein [Anaerolineae bacterium]